MKKVLFALLAAAAVLVGCTKDNENAGSGSVTVDGVTYKLLSGVVAEQSFEEETSGNETIPAYTMYEVVLVSLDASFFDDADAEEETTITEPVALVTFTYANPVFAGMGIDEDENYGEVLIVNPDKTKKEIAIPFKNIKLSKSGKNYSISFSGTEGYKYTPNDDPDDDGIEKYIAKMSGSWNGPLKKLADDDLEPQSLKSKIRRK